VKHSKRRKTYLSRVQAVDLINSINNPAHRLIAKIQYFTGARASEVITIKKTDIFMEQEHKRIRIDIVGKGDKKEPIYLKDDMHMEIQPLYITDNHYLFLKNHEESWTPKLFRTKTESYYKRYSESLKKGAKECGLSLSTHDWRRSFTQSLKNQGADIIDIKKALRHESIITTERYFKDDPESIAKVSLRHQQGI